MNPVDHPVTQDARSGGALDARQKSMLEAMGIKLWQPDAAHAADAPPAQAQTHLQHSDSAHQPTAPVLSESNRATALMQSAQSATETIANIISPKVVIAPPSSPASAPAIRPARPSGVEQMDWAALQSAVSGCQACGLCQSRQNTVFGVGQAPSDLSQAPQVDWLIVGEAPGENEDAQGEPFVGQAGKLLDNMLAAMKVGLGDDGKATGLSRTRGAYIANVLKCRPPANRNPSPEEVATCEPYLARQIELLAPKIILAMGKFAISSLTGSTEPVGKMRGRIHKLQHATCTAPVIVTYHPAYLLRNLPDKAKAWADLLLAMQTYRELLKH